MSNAGNSKAGSYLAFGSLDFLAGQIVGKLWMVLLALPFIAYLRRRDERHYRAVVIRVRMCPQDESALDRLDRLDQPRDRLDFAPLAEVRHRLERQHARTL